MDYDIKKEAEKLLARITNTITTQEMTDSVTEIVEEINKTLNPSSKSDSQEKSSLVDVIQDRWIMFNLCCRQGEVPIPYMDFERDVFDSNWIQTFNKEKLYREEVEDCRVVCWSMFEEINLLLIPIQQFLAKHFREDEFNDVDIGIAYNLITESIKASWAIFESDPYLNRFSNQLAEICDVCKNWGVAMAIFSQRQAPVRLLKEVLAEQRQHSVQLNVLTENTTSLKNDTSFIKQIVERIQTFIERMYNKCFPQKVYSERDLFLFMACRRIFRTGSFKSGKYWGPYTDKQLNHECPKEADVYQHVIAHLEQLSNGEFKWLSKADRVTWRSLKTKYRTWEREQKASQ